MQGKVNYLTENLAVSAKNYGEKKKRKKKNPRSQLASVANSEMLVGLVSFSRK